MKKTMLLPMIVAALAAVFVFGAVQIRNVAAQATTPTPQEAAPAQPNGVKPWRGGELKGGYTDEDLAAALDISVEDLQAAYEQANQAALAQAVEEGLLTQDQADQLLERSAGRFHFDGRWMKGSVIDFNTLLAEELGISTDELQSALQTAHNAAIDRAVENGFLTEEQANLAKGRYALDQSESFRSSLQSAFEQAVQQAVTDGVITQEQADLILQEQANRGLPGFFGKFEDGRMGRGHRHGPGPLPGNELPQQPPSDTGTSGNDI